LFRVDDLEFVVDVEPKERNASFIFVCGFGVSSFVFVCFCRIDQSRNWRRRREKVKSFRARTKDGAKRRCLPFVYVFNVSSVSEWRRRVSLFVRR
jgi:hypothetical protein